MSVPSHFGRYRVLRPLATGEMGVVYLAEDPLIGRHVAIKGIRYDVHSDDDEIQRLQARFDQEIQIAGTFSHPNIVTLYDVGHEEGRSFIAMEYVDGRNLRAELQAHGPMSATRAVELIAPIGRALTYAHERNVIHRDIKPTNVLVSSEGVPKITDFGVARLFGSTLTNKGKIFGTPAYMSPEQARGSTLTGASDQFAVAAMLYELLTGERPFKGTSPTAVIYEVIETDPAPPSELAPLVPTGVSDAVMRGLSKDPQDRYESCAAFSQVLEEAIAWARANPELAYLQPQSMEDAPDQAGGAPDSPVDGWSGKLWEWARQAIAPAESSQTWTEMRSITRRVSEDSRTLGAVAGGTLLLVVAVAVVAWAASGRDAGLGPTARQPTDTAPAAKGSGRAGPTADLSAAGAGDPIAAGAAEDELPPGEPEPATELRRSFVVVSRPAGARVTLDGEPLGEAAPVTIQVDNDERHTLRLELEDHEPLTWVFSRNELSAGHLESGELFFPLRPLTAAETDPATPDADSEPENDAVADAGPDAIEPEASARPSLYGISGPPPSPSSIRRVRAPSQTPTPAKLRHVDLELRSPALVDGVVVLEIEVSARGNVVQARVLRGLDPAIDQAALDAVVRWKYAPTSLAGEPVHVVLTVTVPVRRSPGSR